MAEKKTILTDLDLNGNRILNALELDIYDKYKVYLESNPSKIKTFEEFCNTLSYYIQNLSNSGDGKKYLKDDGTYDYVHVLERLYSEYKDECLKQEITAMSYDQFITRMMTNLSIQTPTKTSDLTNDSGFLTAQDVSGKQDKLVSGTNIKTINGSSILGSGNLVISGSGNGSSAYSVVYHGTSDTTFTLTPNTFHVWDEVTSLIITLGEEISGIANEFLFQFNSGITPTTLALPDTIKWADDSAPTIGANMIYQISILKGLASVLEFSNAPSVTIINFTIRNFSCTAENGMNWEQWVSSKYNTISCALMGDNIHRYGEMVGASSTEYVTKTDTIISDFVYTLIPAI